jgi:hypothetical protein
MNKLLLRKMVQLWAGMLAAGALAAWAPPAAAQDAPAAGDAASPPPAGGDASASAPAASADAGGSAPSGDSGSGSSGDSGSASNGDSGGGMFKDFDISLGGFVRLETAFSTGYENPNNQRGNPYNGVPESRVPGVPTPGIPSTAFVVPNPVLASTVVRPVAPSNNLFNYHTVRGELEAGIKINSNLNFIFRMRALVEPGRYSDFSGSSMASSNEGNITGGDPALYGGAPNYFQYRVDGDRHPNPLEIAGPNYLVYFPVAVLNYTHGPLNVRIGNQQIAWGQMIFFRIFDTPDGLDLRRHLVLGKATEEYSDSRVPAPAIRVGYQVSDAILADVFAEKFQPTMYPNPNTPYNVIPAQFTVHDRYSVGNYENKINYGMRLTADFGQYSAGLMYVRRYNPDGIFRWTKSNVNKDFPVVNSTGGVNELGIVENTLATATGSTGGARLAQTPVEIAPGGVYSANEWFHYAAAVRLNGITALNSLVNDFEPATGQLLADPVTTFSAAHNELDTFFTAAGDSLRGHIARDYFAEDDFGVNLGYVTEAEPGSIFDQILVHLEANYVPNRTYTPVDLGHDPLRQHEWTVGLVAEKYQRFSEAFPATYMVFQALHKTKSDLFGRSLQGYGGTDTSVATGVGGGANYVVLAAIQPFPASIYEAYAAVLADPRGGVLAQPGLRWKPRGDMTVEGFYTYINGHLGAPNRNALSTLDFADEFSLRLTYQF